MIRNLLIYCAFLVCGCAPDSSPPVAPQQDLAAIAAAGSQVPRLAPGPGGGLIMSWLEPDGDGVALRFATLTGENWSAVRTVARGDDWFVNWADFPSVVAIDESLWAAHWLQKAAAGTYEYDVMVSLSTDGGETWHEPVRPHTDGTLSEHGFVSLFPAGGGVGALWLDGREMPDGGGMTLRSVSVLPGNELTDAQLADDLVCDCCQTGVAMGPQGPVAVYRNRTTDEIRDIYVTRMFEGRWEPGRPVADDGWEIAGCPVNGPAIAARGRAVAVAWFTAAGNEPKVRVAFSGDGAATFSNAIDVATDAALGRVGLVLLDGGDALVSWLASGEDGDGEIKLRRISADGSAGQATTVATTASGRMSGFPQVAALGKRVVVAWTDTDGDSSQVRARLLDPDRY